MLLPYFAGGVQRSSTPCWLIGAAAMLLANSLAHQPAARGGMPDPATFQNDAPFQSAGSPESTNSVSKTISFQNDVQPILTRFGCNSGACHGKLAGQGGFRLSLRGYAPEDDYKSLEFDELGRRLNALAPDESLLLLKATGRITHGGGQLFSRESPAYRALRKWIADGAPGPVANEASVSSIVVTPKTITLASSETKQLAVMATYSDGTERDVTWLAKFQSNDVAFADVSATGLLRAVRNGETSLVISFQGVVDTVVVTMPYSTTFAEEVFATTPTAIDRHVMHKLKQLRIPPSEPCDDATYLRRVMLDLIGTLPTHEEVAAFEVDTAHNKREVLVDGLMARPEFVDFWTLQISDLLQNRKERDHDVRGVKGVRSLHAWIRGQVSQNRPWDALVREVLTARGSTSQSPAVGYYIVTVGEKPAHESEVADSVAQAFLGMRIGCARCHNHPLERYTQDDYYHFIAFFSQVALDRKAPQDGDTVLERASRQAQDLRRRLRNEEKELAKLEAESAPDAGKLDSKKRQLEQVRQELEKALKAAPMVTQPRTGKQLAPQGLDRLPISVQAGADPREQLADWITADKPSMMAGAIVNRLWKHFFAVGLVEPVDDLRETNPPSNQPLFNAMVDEFIASKYDLRKLMKSIVLSRTYGLSSSTSSENASDTRFYSHYYAKRLPAEVLLDAIGDVTGVPDTFPNYPVGTRAKQLPGPQIDSYFLTAFGRSDRVTACACERSGDVTLSQLLHLQNGENILQKLRDGKGKLAGLLEEQIPTEELIGRMLMATCNRKPTEAELAELLKAFESADRAEAATDLMWALLNSKEFTFNH